MSWTVRRPLGRTPTALSHSSSHSLLALLLALLLLLTLAPSAQAQDAAPTDADPAATPAQVSWVEPRGINIVDVVGIVPEAHLKGITLTSGTGYGMATYVSGSRSGNTVTINVNITPRYYADGANVSTIIGCLGQFAAFDQWPSTSPAGSVRLYANGRDVTSTLRYRYIIPAGLYQPPNPATAYDKYTYGPNETVDPGNGAFPIPANMGCRMIALGRYTGITATFTFPNVPRKIIVTPLGAETFQAHSYIGVGNAGILNSLRGQMGRYGNRHDKFDLSVPSGADFMLVRYAPSAVDMYASQGAPENAGLPGSGTWRLETGGGLLTVDHVNSMLTPIRNQWVDIDEAGGSFLSYRKDFIRFATPEYFLPPGIAYNACMTNGGCPDALLAQIYNHTYPVDIFYYQVQRVQDAGLTRIPLRMIGSGGSAAALELSAPLTADAVDAATAESSALLASIPADAELLAEAVQIGPNQGGRRVLMPLVHGKQDTPDPEPSPDPTDGCPCGWFDGTGRMFDFIP